MKKLAWTTIGAAMGVVFTTALISRAGALEGKISLFGEAPKGAQTGSTWNFQFKDPKSGKIIEQRKGEIQVKDGRYLARSTEPGSSPERFTISKFWARRANRSRWRRS